MTNLVTEVARLKRELAQVKKGQRLSHGASIENAAIEVRDDTGSLRAIVGQQGDGTTGAIVVNGPPPPQPSVPIVGSVLGGATASWDGQFTGGAIMPLDWSRIEVHASTVDDFTPDPVTLQSTIETAQGATVVIPCENDIYVRFVARSTSGTASAPSGAAGPVGPAPVVATDIIDGIVTTVKLADDAVTQAKVAVGAIGTTEISDDAVTTPKIVAGAVQTAQLDAEAVNASKIAAGAVTTAKLDALAVTADKLAVNSVTAEKILAGSVSAQALTVGIAQSIVTKLTDTMADSSIWVRAAETGTYVTVTGVTDAVAGSTVMQVSGPASMERAENIPFDAAALYRVTVRLRTTTAPTAGSPLVYLGLTGVAADGTTRVNTAGAAVLGVQHYVAAAALSIPASTTWTTLTGYIQGTAATGTATAAPDPRTPGKAHANVRYIRPLLRLLNGATGGVMQVDQVTVETVPTGVVNSVNIANGAVTADAIAANAITGKTITGGTVTGATIQTATTGSRIVLDTNHLAALDSGSNMIAEFDPADSTGRCAFKTYDTRFGLEYYGALTAGDLRFGIAEETSPGDEGFMSYSSLGSNGYELLLSSGRQSSSYTPARLSLYASDSASANNSEIYLDATSTNVVGTLTAGNIAFGQTTITPSAAHTPTSTTVIYNITGTSFYGQVTANTTVPGVRTPVGAAGVSGVSVSSATATSMIVWVNRENTTATNINWMVTGK